MFKSFEELDYMLLCFVLLIIVMLGLTILGVHNMEQYIVDHKCEVTETKTETHLQPIPVGKVMSMVPVTSTRNHYHCKIDGKKGRDFWY